MADEYFYALTLKGAKASEVWDPESKGGEDLQGGHKLIIKQALLGADAVEGEVNVIQVEAMTWKESVTIPVAVLKSGSQNQVLLDLSFPDPPVTFSLAQGSGPVHIIGHHLIGSAIDEFDEMDEMEEEMLDDEEGEEGAEEDEEEDEGPKNKKAKTTSSNAKGKTPVKNTKKK
ncbi:nucleoplasmin-like protein isoform X2 [Agrilus planipennis]|uniref:Nucleoplasmin-like protein isoform X2 n=1 Tax=Agrilus planipennis TaxID=224129 RepID=A0A1W4WGM7_AGRPL|nr:nucleoplasmin-like protein isoform X2 [Agrilus planipennis]